LFSLDLKRDEWTGVNPLSKLETPWNLRQIETHLVFGPLIRAFPWRRPELLFIWLVSKIIFGTLAVVFVVLIFPMTLSEHQRDAWAVLCLGLIWFPFLWLFPALVPYQKYFTLSRLLLSIPALIWFCNTAIFT
jgi:hypothetical protein